MMLLINDYETNHCTAIKALFEAADHVSIVVAFLKLSGMKMIRAEIEKHLAAGKTAELVIGADFFITEPEALRIAYGWSQNYNVKVIFVYGNKYSFHPKIYISRVSEKYTMIVGSANLTSGGLGNNYEVSLISENCSLEYVEEVEKMVKSLVDEGQALPLDPKIISEYEKKYKIYRSLIALSIAKAERLAAIDSAPIEILELRLAEMKADTSGNGFEAQRIIRQQLRAEAREALDKLITSGSSREEFSAAYKLMVQKWTSTGNIRLASMVAEAYQKIVPILSELVRRIKERNFDPYAFLHTNMATVRGFGVNAITEILHTLDNENYAVLNDNSAHGIKFGSDIYLPSSLSKMQISPKTYAEFRHETITLKKKLNLGNLSELDAVFSYIYFS